MIIDTKDPLLNAEMFIDPQYLSFFCPNVFMLYIFVCVYRRKKMFIFFILKFAQCSLHIIRAYESIAHSCTRPFVCNNNVMRTVIKGIKKRPVSIALCTFVKVSSSAHVRHWMNFETHALYSSRYRSHTCNILLLKIIRQTDRRDVNRLINMTYYHRLKSISLSCYDSNNNIINQCCPDGLSD